MVKPAWASLKAMHEFLENPFRNLKLRTGESQQALAPAVSPSDAALFRRAVERLSEKRAGRRQSGFKIGEQCRLPVIVKSKTVSEPEPPKSEPVAPAENEFLAAMRDVRPVSKKGRAIALRPASAAPAAPAEATFEDLLAGGLEFAVSGTDEYLEGHVVGMDELLMNRLREGQFSPEAHYDLHGLNSEQAFESLKEFIHSAWLKDLRSVLVITGRGRNSPAGQGILRHKIQTWLTREPFKRVVLAFCTAKPHDGGPGSIYILLRRFRKKGPILWQRQFVESDID